MQKQTAQSSAMQIYQLLAQTREHASAQKKQHGQQVSNAGAQRRYRRP